MRDPRWLGPDVFLGFHSFIDQRSLFADALQTTLRPTGFSDEAWQSVLPNLRALTGETWGDYVRALSRNAEYLGRLGLNVTDVSELWSFQMQQAIGMTPVGTLGAVSDARVELPGGDLSFGRYFTPSLLGRLDLGVFGRGWSMAGGWQNLLTVDSEGTVTITGAGGAQRRFGRDLRGGYLSAVGDYAVLSQDGSGFLFTEQSGQKTRYRSDGRVDYVEDTNGNRLTASYSDALLTGLSEPAGGLTLEYNSFGRIAKITDAVGRVTQYTYDATGEHLLSVLGSDGQTTTYTYDTSTDPLKRHAILSITAPGGDEQHFTYDALGRLSRVATCPCGGTLGEPITYTYDIGQITAADALGNATQTYFDHRGRVAKTVDALGRPSYFDYDAYSNLTVVTDAASQRYDFKYDRRGNLIESFNPLGVTTRFEYQGPFGALTKVIDGRGNPLSYDYDLHGNLIGIIYADGSKEQFDYNTAGDLATDTNRRRQPISQTYDSAGRIESQAFPDGTKNTFAYDVRGNLIRATDASGDTILTYDSMDRLTRIDYPTGRWLAYEYDAADRRTRLTGPDHGIRHEQPQPVCPSG